MFCSKCGNKLPDGAMFCSSCGSPVNVQPSVPVQPVVMTEPTVTPEPVVMAEPIVTPEPVVSPEPVVAPEPIVTPEPVVSTEPVIPAVTSEAPVFTPAEPVAPEAPVFTPTEPVAPVAPTFTATEPMANNMTIPVAPSPQNNALTPKKKSKAPLFIGLGIGVLVIAIVALVLVLVLSDDDKDDSPASATEANTTLSSVEKETTEEPTTKEPVTEEPTTDGNSSEVNTKDVKKLANNILADFKNLSFDSFETYLLPGMKSYFEDNGYSTDSLMGQVALTFCDNDGNFLDYKVKNVTECDDTFFDDSDMNKLLRGFAEYKKPTAFAKATVEFTYESQSSSIDMHFAYVDGKCYFYDYDDTNFDIELETESESESESQSTSGNNTTLDNKAISDMLASNYKTVSDPGFTGTTYQGDGYHLTVPADWNSDTSSMPTFSSNVGNANFNIVSEVANALTLYSIEDLLKLYCDTYTKMNCTDIKVGNLQATYTNGYFIEYTYPYSADIVLKGVQFIYPNKDNTSVHIVTVTTDDLRSDAYSDAESAAASFQLD